MLYIKIKDQLLEGKVEGNILDYTWDNRSTKTITLPLSYEEMKDLFKDGIEWSIVETYTEDTYDINGMKSTVEKERVYNNADYNLSGPITDNRDDTVSIKMGKMTELEEAYVMLIGG